MIYDNLEFFNVEELYEINHVPGKVLGRIKQETRKQLDEDGIKTGVFNSSYSNECEIRFVTVKKNIQIYLSALERDGYINVYNGDYLLGSYKIEQGKINCIDLVVNNRLYDTKEKGKNIRFNQNVWRIVFIKRFTAIYHGINAGNCDIRPPKKEELPTKTFLVYGSSISFGALSGVHTDMSHMQILARKLNYQAVNKSMAGSCFCEKAFTDMLVNIPDIDFFLYEIGGNMRRSYSVAKFKERFTYLMDETIKRNRDKYIFLIDVYWHMRVIPFEDNETVSQTIDGYNKVMSDYIKKSEHKNLILIDSESIITDYSLLCADTLHPSPYGSIVMAENLYEKISKYVLK